MKSDWQWACKNLLTYVEEHLPLRFNAMADAITSQNVTRARTSLFQMGKILNSFSGTISLLGITHHQGSLYQTCKKSIKMVNTAHYTIDYELNRQRKAYMQSMRLQGYLSYEDLCNLATGAGSLIRWKTTGVIETLYKKGNGDRRLWAKGPVTKGHVISKRGLFFWCENPCRRHSRLCSQASCLPARRQTPHITR